MIEMRKRARSRARRYNNRPAHYPGAKLANISWILWVVCAIGLLWAGAMLVNWPAG
jgi:hypothetical protein